MKNILVFLLITFCFTGNSQTIDSVKIKPKIIPGWTFWLPGASHFYQGNIVQGSIFSTLEIGGTYLGIRYDNNLKNNSSTPYYNYPLLIGLQAFQTEKLTLFRNQLEVIKYRRPDFKYDELSDKDLYLAPFKVKNIFTPITGGMMLLAAAFLGVEKLNETNRYNDIDKMYVLNRYMGRDQSMAIFGVTSLAISWSAGVGEEYVCRNYMLPILDYRYGQKKGLIISSAIFGGMHFANVLFADKPDYKAALFQVGEATLAGYFLGRDVQKRGYNIGPAVAAHMWYDFTLMLGSFLINPKNNYLGVNLKFKL